ncbi:FAD-dependent oxidoreductase [Actinomadura sp. SCN-SB]|uniref:FAD-dependent oxidoreductase n=1 Tax=Actinomadura sp. SCN-SB TaxID=3373092 RepID=UPI0037537FCA
MAGGSIAGLATAQALAETFDTVTLVERDGYPPRGEGFRRGVPQARHLHALWEGGQRALEQLFPGLTLDLRRVGAHQIGAPEDLRWLNARGWCIQFAPRPDIVCLLDHTVRQRLTATPNVTILNGWPVTGLLPDATGVRGVHLTCADGSAGEHDVDLVVDATGRNTRTPALAGRTRRLPATRDRIHASPTYASRAAADQHLPTFGIGGLQPPVGVDAQGDPGTLDANRPRLGVVHRGRPHGRFNGPADVRRQALRRVGRDVPRPRRLP